MRILLNSYHRNQTIDNQINTKKTKKTIEYKIFIQVLVLKLKFNFNLFLYYLNNFINLLGLASSVFISNIFWGEEGGRKGLSKIT